MFKIATLASGSSGNCLLASDGSTHVLIDAGISARRTTAALKSLGVEPGALSAILITHEHSDHIKGLGVLSRQIAAPVYTTDATGRQLCYRMAGLEERLREFTPGDRFQIGTLAVSTFPTSHDCACPVGYAVADEHGAKMALATDLGVVTEHVRRGIAGARLTVVEANYDPELLRWGPYPVRLKERIMSEYGHLSNEEGGALALCAVEHGARRVILGHLSKENNTPQLACEAVARVLTEGGVHTGRDCILSVASRDKCDGWVEV